MRLLLFFMCACLLAVWSEASASRSSRTSFFSGVFALSKSTVGVLADPRTRDVKSSNLVFVEAGTRLMVFPEIVKSVARRPHVLSLVEDGRWAFLPRRSYFTNTNSSDFGFDSDFVFITRVQAVDFDGYTVYLGPTEVYEAKEFRENDVLISASKEIVLSNTENGRKIATLEFDVEVPYRKVRIANLKPIKDKEEINFFIEGAYDNFLSFSKSCGSELVNKTQISGNVGAEGSFLIFNLGASAEEEVSEISKFGPELSVTKKYFTRSQSGGRYSLLTIRECEGENANETRKYFSKDGHNDLIIDRTFGERYGLRISESTGEVFISCYDDYDAFRSALISEGAREDEVDFLITIAADWESNITMDVCSRGIIAASSVTIQLRDHTPRPRPK